MQPVLSIVEGNNEHLTISYRLTQNAPQTVIFEIPLCLGAFVAAIWAKQVRKINLFMQNKPNLCVFWAVNGDCEEKQTQFKPNSNPISPPSPLRLLQLFAGHTAKIMFCNRLNGKCQICFFNFRHFSSLVGTLK